MNRRPNSTWSTGYHLLLAVIGWSVLCVATFGGWGAPLVPEGGWTVVIPYVAFAMIARAMAIRPFAGVSVSLDTAFYVAAVLALGVMPAAWMVTGTVTLEALLRQVRGLTRRERERDALNATSYILARGAVPGAIIVVVSLIFGVPVGGLAAESVGQVLWLVPVLSACLLIPAYAWIGVGLWIEGHQAGHVIRRMFSLGLVAELLIFPLAMVIVIVHDPRQPLPLILLGLTFVLVNLVVKLLVDALSAVRHRLVELEVLGEVGRAIAGNLQLTELIPQIARETIKLVGRTSKCMVAVAEEDSNTVQIEVFDADGALLESDAIPKGDGLTGQVMTSRQTLLLNELQREVGQYRIDDQYRDDITHSWMGTPLIVYDEVIGMLNVQSEERGAYNDAQARVFETIAAQAAVAIQNARLYELATVDGLTRLYVRRYFDLRLREEIQLARRHDGDFTVMLLDLDNFKSLNDTYGHTVGDKVLREIARVVRGCMRDSDIPCRYGGEEFGVVMPRTSLEAASMVAERIRADVAAHTVVTDGHVLTVTTSIGLVSRRQGPDDSPTALVARADEALYVAKRAGKNRVEVADAPIVGAAQAG